EDAVAQQEVAGGQPGQQQPGQAGLAGAPAGVGPEDGVQAGAGGQAEQRDDAQQGEAHPAGEVLPLRVGRLVLVGGGGAADGAVDDLDAPAAPAPVLGGLVLQAPAEGRTQLAEEGLGELGAGLAVGAGVDRAGRLAQAQPPGQGAGDGGGA